MVVCVSYKKLWKLLIDKDMTRTDLRDAIGASTSTFAKLSRGELISGNIMMKICRELGCNIGDMMDVVLDDEESELSAKRATKRPRSPKAKRVRLQH